MKKQKSKLKEVLSKISMIAGWGMMAGLIVFLIVPSYISLIPFEIALFVLVVTGLWANGLDKEGGGDNGKYND